uniref:Uncharacterized protein n=1 Tax=Rhodopseudomonas palustris (strain BisA53) TaxID=316055 RepID=Q07TJ4_RHOP5
MRQSIALVAPSANFSESVVSGYRISSRRRAIGCSVMHLRGAMSERRALIAAVAMKRNRTETLRRAIARSDANGAMAAVGNVSVP